jgi:hypothetical protein
LEKGKGDVRPIAVGELLYRVAAKAILRTLFKEDMLLPNQLGVCSKGGVEPAVFQLAEAIEGPNQHGYSSICSLDFENAFNTVDRVAMAAAIARFAPTFYRAARWAYDRPSILVTARGHLLVSASGVRQGDPLGPLYFSLALRPTIASLNRALPEDSVTAYLDDVYVLHKGRRTMTPVTPATPATPAILKAVKGAPVRLNSQKSSETLITDLRETGLEALGTFIGPKEGRQRFLAEKAENLKRILRDLHALPRQHAALLLRGSSQCLLRHLQRQLNPEGLEEIWQQVDQMLLETVELLAELEPGRNQTAKDLAALPTKAGGLGIPSFAEGSIELYKAARADSYDRIGKIRPLAQGERRAKAEASLSLPVKQIRKSHDSDRLADLESKLSPAALRARQENASFLGRYWLQVSPTQKPLALTDAEAVASLRTRLLIPVTLEGALCPLCGAPGGSGHEDTCRAAERAWIARHDKIVRAFYNAFKGSEIKVRLEPALPRHVQQQQLPSAAAAAAQTVTTRAILSTLSGNVAVPGSPTPSTPTEPSDPPNLKAPPAPTEASAGRAITSTPSGLANSRWARTRPANPAPSAPAPSSLAQPELRADFSLTEYGEETFYDVTIVAVNSSSARKEALETLAAAAKKKRLKYRALGKFFEPIVISPGGLFEKQSAQTFKRLQAKLPDSTRQQLQAWLAITLARARATSAGSITGRE